MEGISVAAAIVGLISAAAKITLGLNNLIAWVKEAPKLANAVLLEVADISACLCQVQSLLLGAGRVDFFNQSLLMVEEIVVVLSNCVMIFSDLEQLVEGLILIRRTSINYLLQWATREKAVAALLLRLQSSKTSLSLMISTMTYRSIEEAQSSVGQLTDVVRKLLESNQDIFERLGCMELKNPDDVSTISRIVRNSVSDGLIDDHESIDTIRQLNVGPFSSKAAKTKFSNARSELECLLESSRPYVRASRRLGSRLSTTSSVIQTLGWSCLSGISLAEVSNISVIELALDKQHIWNSTRYDTRRQYLGTIAEGMILKIYSDDVPPFEAGFGSACCRECDMVGKNPYMISLSIPF